jgi:hypothetical protein
VTEPGSGQTAPVLASPPATEIDWTVEVMKHPAWRDFYEREMARNEKQEPVRAAFIEVHRKAVGR